MPPKGVLRLREALELNPTDKVSSPVFVDSFGGSSGFKNRELISKNFCPYLWNLLKNSFNKSNVEW